MEVISMQIENVNSVLEWVRGVARCPYSPEANVTALLTRSGHYFAGSPMDFSGADPAISRSLAGVTSSTIRTKQFDSKWLNEPQFVGSFETSDFVYFLFRESAVEYINCGKVRNWRTDCAVPEVIPLLTIGRTVVAMCPTCFNIERLQDVNLVYSSRYSDWVTCWTTQESWFDIRQGQEIFFILLSVQSGSGARLVPYSIRRVQLDWDGSRAETRFCLSVKWESSCNLAGVKVQPTTGRWGVHISLQGLHCSWKPVFCSLATLTGYPLHSPAVMWRLLVTHFILLQSCDAYWLPTPFSCSHVTLTGYPLHSPAVMWRLLVTHSTLLFPLHFSSDASSCAMLY